jgi:glycerol kinase
MLDARRGAWSAPNRESRHRSALLAPLPLACAAVACLLAVDAGTSGVRTLAFDESGIARTAAYRPLSARYPQPGWVEQDPEEIWALVAETLVDVARTTVDRGEQIAGIGITNQRETALAWDRTTGSPLHAAIVWQDRRTAARCDELADAGLLPLVRERTGLVLDPYFSATKFEWLLDHVGVGRRHDVALGTVDAWLLFRLSGGEVFATDVTNASRTMLFDIRARAWTSELCDVFGIPLGALPEVRPSCGRLGTVAADGGLGSLAPLHGVPISGVAGDQQAALLGHGCIEPGMAKVTYGTGSFLLAHAGPSCPAPHDGLLSTIAWDLDGHELAKGGTGLAYALEGSTFVAGAAIQWLRDGLGLIARSEELASLAASVPDAGGVVVVPAFSGLGSPWWDPRARGVVTGITRGTGRAQLARAVVEAMAFAVRDMADAITQALRDDGMPALTELRADGGASAMDILLQVQADQLQLRVGRPACTECSARGAAMLAGIAESAWNGQDARVAPARTCTPSLDRQRADLAYDAWLHALERARRWVAPS